MADLKKYLLEEGAYLLKKLGGKPNKYLGTRTNVTPIKTPPLLTDLIAKGTKIDDNFIKQAEETFGIMVGNKNISEAQLSTYLDNLEFANNMKNPPLYIDTKEMDNLMKEAYYGFEEARSAVINDKLDDARGILRYEIEENYKYPKVVRDAAADARYMITRGAGVEDWEKMGYESQQEALDDLLTKISEGQNKTSQDYWPDVTDPIEGAPKNVEYYDYFTDLPEETRNPDAIFTDIKDTFGEFAKGGIVNARKNFYSGGGSGDTGPGGGPSDTGSGHTGDSIGSGDTGDLGSTEENEQALGSAMASIGGIGGYGDPNQGYFGSRFGNFVRNVQNAIAANPGTSLAASSILGPIGSLGYGALKAYGKTAEPGSQPPTTDESDENTSNNYLVQRAIQNPLGGITNAANAQIVDDYYDVYSSLLRPQAAEGGIMTTREAFATKGRTAKQILDALMKKMLPKVKYKEDYVESMIPKEDVISELKKLGVTDPKQVDAMIGQMQDVGIRIYDSKMKYPSGIAGGKSGLPVDDKKLVPKTDLKKVRSQKKANDEGIKSLAKSGQIPVKDVTEFSFAKERERLTNLIDSLQTDFLKKDRMDDLKILNKVEELGGDEAMYNDLRMRKYKGLSSKSDYRANPESAEAADAAKMRKTEKEIDELLGTKFGDDGDPNMFDDIFNKMFTDYKEGNIPDYIPGEEPLTKPVKKTPRKDNAEGGLNYLMGF